VVELRLLKLPIGNPEKQGKSVKPRDPDRKLSETTASEDQEEDTSLRGKRNTSLMEQVVADENREDVLEKFEEEKVGTAP